MLTESADVAKGREIANMLGKSHKGFPGDASGKKPACQCRRCTTWVRSLGQEDSLEKGMATHSSILAWRIPWTQEPGIANSWT